MTAGPTIWVAGVPRAGKTTLAEGLAAQGGLDLLHTDDWRHLPWEDVPAAVLSALRGRTGYVLEGVQVGRVIRRAAKVGDPSRPDEVWLLARPRTPLSPGQAAMAKGVMTIWAEAAQALAAWGIQVRIPE